MGSPIQVNRLIAKEQEGEERLRIETEKLKIFEAQKQREFELREERRIKKEAKRLEEERKKKEDEEGGGFGMMNMMSKTKGRGTSPSKLMGKNIASILRQSLNSQLSTDYNQ